MKYPIMAFASTLMMLSATTEIYAHSTKETTMKQIISTRENGNVAVYKTAQKSKTNILFLHGDSGRASQWADVMNIVGDAHSTISFDFRGHGNSEPATDNDYSLSGRTQDIELVADEHIMQPFILVAHSGGGAVALEYAALHPNKVKGILLIEPATDSRGMPEDMKQGFMGALSSPAALETIQGYYASISGGDPAVIAQIQDDAAVVNKDARFGVAEALLNWNPEPALNAITYPVEMHVIEANDNPAALYHLNPAIKHHLLTNIGHWVQLDAPELIASIVLDFANRLEK